MEGSCWSLFIQCPWVCCGLTFLLLVSIMLMKSQRKLRKEIIVFTRYPRPGKAKTRLIPALGEVGACMLQIRMTEHIVKTLEQTQNLMDTKMNVTLQFNGGTEKDMHYWMDRKFHNIRPMYRPQAEGSLGVKLSSAVRDSFSRGNTQVIVIGADIPGISATVIQDAFAALSTDSNTAMTIGPAADGGYYLIGFNTKAKDCLDDIFVDIDWGTDKVFDQQVDRAKALSVEPTVLKQVLNDVDTLDDLEVFEKEVGIDRQQIKTQRWSIVVPALNEEAGIVNTLQNILEKCNSTNNITEIIVSDGGSGDRTVGLVQEFSKTCPVDVRVIHSKPGRGHQQIAAADVTKGDNLLFVHADTKLPKDFDLVASACLRTPGNVAGAFEFCMDVLVDEKLMSSESWWFIKKMQFVAFFANIRSRKYELPYGDQALFMSKTTYQEVGGFPPFYLMEDFCLVNKLQTIGHVAITDGYRAVTDYRRWRKWGLIRVTGLNHVLVLAYKCGVHPDTLAKVYYRDKLKTE